MSYNKINVWGHVKLLFTDELESSTDSEGGTKNGEVKIVVDGYSSHL